MRKFIDIVFAAFCSAALTGCPDNKSAEETGPASSLGETSGGSHAAGETGSEPSAPQRPEAMPLLCTIDGGKWCSSCSADGSGVLCCTVGGCSPWSGTGSACDGVAGWCNTYSVSESDPGVVVCHD